MERIHSRSAHDTMVKTIAKLLINKGYSNVKADIPGHPTPEKITWASSKTGHIPDNSAYNNKREQLIFEVETDGSIYDQHTEDQWKLFSAYVNQHGGEFWIVVPFGSENKVNNRISELNVTAKVWQI